MDTAAHRFGESIKYSKAIDFEPEIGIPTHI